MLAAFEDGKDVGDIAAGRTRSATKATDATANKIKKILKADNRAAKNSTREMAAKIKVSQSTIRKASKSRLQVKTLKLVEAAINAASALAKRETAAKEIAGQLDAWLDPATI